MKRQMINEQPLHDSSSYSDDKAYCTTTGHQFRFEVVDGVMYKTCAQCGEIKQVTHHKPPEED